MALQTKFRSKTTVHCSPLSSLIDDKNKITIDGLCPSSDVTIQARLQGDSKERFYSFAHYTADCEGRVDLHTQPSVGGFYRGIEPMGLLWSMMPETGQRKGLRLAKKEVTTPYKISLTVHRGHYKGDDVMFEGEAVCCTTFEKWYMGVGVRRIVITEGKIRATLFLPPGDGPFPGVLDMFGSVGGKVEYRAALLASHGFASLALAFFRYDDLTDKLEDLCLEYFIEAAEWLSNHPHVLPGGIGVTAVSKGAEIGLLLAANFKQIKAVVAISSYHCIEYSPISYRGKMTPYVPCQGEGYKFENDGSLIVKDCYMEDWDGDITENPYMIPVENTKCPILLIYGTDDSLMYVEDSAEKIMNRMDAHGKKSQVTVLMYEGAGHLIEPPYTPLCSMAYHVFKMYMKFGGEPVQHAKAQEDSWRKILGFLWKNLTSVPSKL
ncbi:predicted protein [Nematostella vectensis]|uniref:Uncharacterized protein n=1 Tax=Nematostella vectensis TaxID=45351 RepID=A7RMP4_NEMVE|nr:predicted protein [Nematostella vectensis]|eukprot:XP_001639445.1 predicted protein [Nematostella vectensis]